MSAGKSIEYYSGDEAVRIVDCKAMPKFLKCVQRSWILHLIILKKKSWVL